MIFCSLQSGSCGNAQFIQYKNTKILIDAGLNGKQTALRLAAIGVNIDDLDAIILTHEHIDHISGAGVISRRHHIPIYANEATHEASHNIIKDIGKENRRFFDGEFYIKDLFIKPFSIMHDAVDPVGFAIYGNKKISVITDTGIITDTMKEESRHSHLYYIEANHDPNMLEYGSYSRTLKNRVKGEYGHLSNMDAGEFLIEASSNKLSHAVLGHLSYENNNEHLCYETVNELLNRAGLELDLSISHRDACGKLIDLDRI